MFLSVQQKKNDFIFTDASHNSDNQHRYVIWKDLFTAFNPQTKVFMRDTTSPNSWHKDSCTHNANSGAAGLLCYQQLNSPRLSFPSSPTKASERTEQGFPMGPQTACLNLVLVSAVSFLYYGFRSLWLSSEGVAHGTKRGHLCCQTL